LGPGPGEVGQGGLSLPLVTLLTKNLQPPTKKCFFIANYKTCWVFWGF